MRNTLFLFLLFTGTLLSAQKNTWVYFVAFKDKGNTYSLSKPTAYLSAKSIERRTKFSIKIDSTDLPVNEPYIKVVTESGVKLRNKSKWLNGISIDVTDTTVLRKIAALPFVVSVTKTAFYKQTSRSEASDAFDFSDADTTRKGNTDPYGQSLTQIKMLQGTQLHKLQLNGEHVNIAVLDAGFFNAHKLPWFKRLQSNQQILATKDFVENDDYVFDGNSHGLEVLSCMAATDSGNFIGTAPGARYLLLRSEDAATEQLIEEVNWSVAAEYADSFGVDLITTSLGYTVFDDKSMGHRYAELDGHTALITQAAETAVSKGIFVVCSAGNDGESSWKHIGCPADAEHVLAVGAVGFNRKLAGFSSYGPSPDGRIKPDVCAMGYYAAVQSPYGGVSLENGTSFSAPITAGMVACLMQAHPNKSPAALFDAIIKSADRHDMPDSFYGYGIPDFYMAHLLLQGNMTNTADELLDVTYNASDKIITFAIKSAASQMFRFKILDDAGNIIRTGTQSSMANKITRFYIDGIQLPMSDKGYAFVLLNEKNESFIRLF